MTPYEWTRILCQPILPVYMTRVRRDIKALIRKSSIPIRNVLDVGGRKSPYTIGLPVEVTVIDLPRETELQSKLHLGLTKTITDETAKRRSNIRGIILGDMLNHPFEEKTYDAVISVEVIEHVKNYELFLERIKRVLKPGGFFYLTTPNGDYIKHNPQVNPDHQRHFTRAELESALKKYFHEVSVVYGVHTGKYRVWGQKPFSLKHPIRTLRAMAANFISHFQSKNVESHSQRTAVLFAFAINDRERTEKEPSPRAGATLKSS